MLLTVSDIVGLPGVPSTNRGVRDWLKRNGVPLSEDGNRFTFEDADLPRDIQLALSARHIEAEGLEPGEREEAAHAKLEEATPKMQAKAARLAQLAVFMVKREADGWKKPDIFAEVRNAFGAEGTSEASPPRALTGRTSLTRFTR